MPTKTERKDKEQKHIRGPIQTCGYPNRTFVKTSKRSRAERDEETEKCNNIVIPYVSSEKLRRTFNKHHILVHFKPTNTLRQKLVHPKDKTPRHKQNIVVYAVQCSQDCTHLYNGETKQPLHKRMAQYRRTDSSGQSSAVHLHLKEKKHSFEDNNINILVREDSWFEKVVKESIYVNLEWPSLNRGSGLRLYLSLTYNGASPESITTIHSCAHLAQTSHMKASWVTGSQEALTALKLLHRV